jgi:hypothetical protein
LHLADFVIVAISVIDLWVLVPLGNGNSSGMAVMRIARLAKLAKVFRVVRVLRAFKPLRVLVSTIAHSVSALGWSMTLLFVFELIGSIFLAQLLQPYIKDDSNDLESRRNIWMHFGTWTRAMYSAYEITMAPGGFIQYRSVIEKASPLVGVFFVIYGCTVTFAVIRVITALFLKATIAACDSEDADDKQRTLVERNQFAEKLQESINPDGTGGIDYKEFNTLIEIPHMKDWLQDAGLTTRGAKRLFHSLMDHKTHEMNFDDFLAALSHMNGPPSSADLIVISQEMVRVLSQTSAIVHMMENRFQGERRSLYGMGDLPLAMKATPLENDYDSLVLMSVGAS